MERRLVERVVRVFVIVATVPNGRNNSSTSDVDCTDLRRLHARRACNLRRFVQSSKVRVSFDPQIALLWSGLRGIQIGLKAPATDAVEIGAVTVSCRWGRRPRGRTVVFRFCESTHCRGSERRLTPTRGATLTGPLPKLFQDLEIGHADPPESCQFVPLCATFLGVSGVAARASNWGQAKA
jgi:hypothetical protein